MRKVINGSAIGGGCEISLACDIRIIEENAEIGLPEIKLGVIPVAGGLFRLPKLVGSSNALKLMLRGNLITAEEAYRIGLVNHVVPPGESIDKAISIVDCMVQTFFRIYRSNGLHILFS